MIRIAHFVQLVKFGVHAIHEKCGCQYPININLIRLIFFGKDDKVDELNKN